MSGSSGWTVEHLSGLRDMAAAGVLETTFADGRKVRYSTLTELLTAITLIETDLRARGLVVAPVMPEAVYSVFDRF
jgi:hypothetical protein